MVQFVALFGLDWAHIYILTVKYKFLFWTISNMALLKPSLGWNLNFNLTQPKVLTIRLNNVKSLKTLIL